MPPQNNQQPTYGQQPGELPTPVGPPAEPSELQPDQYAQLGPDQPQPAAAPAPQQAQPAAPQAVAPGTLPAPAPVQAAQPAAPTPLHTTQPAAALPTPQAPGADKEADRYDFFLKDKPKPKKSLMPNLETTFSKIVAGAAALAILLIVLAIIISLVRGGQEQSPGLLTIVSRQQEIIRVSGLGTQELTSTTLKNFAATAQITTTTSQQELIRYIGLRGGEVDKKALTLQKDAQIDNVLAAAKSASTYDTTFKSTMQQMLTDYEADLQEVKSVASLESEVAILDKNIESSDLLLQMLNQ